MAANDLNAWLASLMPNAGAGQSYGPGGAPYGTSPAGFMPGGGAMGYGAQTPGQPSMGYPALGQPGPQAAPASAAQNPIMQALNALNPIGSAQAAEAPAPSQIQDSLTVNPHGDRPPNVMSPDAMYQRQYGGPMAAADAAHPAPPQPVQGGQRGMPFPQDPGPASRNMPFVGSTANSGQYDPRGYFAPTPPGSPSATPRPKGPLASSSGGGGATIKRTPGAPNLGYYQGNNNRFGTVQYQTPNSVGSRAPIYTALNLGGGSGGGKPAAGAPAVNPNVPAANAQPVSASAPNAYPGDAGWDVDAQGNSVPSYGDLQNWNYGPLQRGNIWRGSGGPSGRINR